MSRGSRVGAAALAGLGTTLVLAVLSPPDVARANGDTQREIQGRVVAADPATGTLVVERAFRGKTARITLVASKDVRVFACAGETAGLDRVKRGATISVFYEVAGVEGVANMIVLEPGR